MSQKKREERVEREELELTRHVQGRNKVRERRI